MDAFSTVLKRIGRAHVVQKTALSDCPNRLNARQQPNNGMNLTAALRPQVMPKR